MEHKGGTQASIHGSERSLGRLAGNLSVTQHPRVSTGRWGPTAGEEVPRKQGVMVHACNPRIWEAAAGGQGFKTSLVYRVKHHLAWTTQLDAISK